MSSMPTPRNRRERRAEAKQNGTSTSTSSHLETSLPSIPLSKPDYDYNPKAHGHKTLYDIAAERQAELEASGFYAKHPPPAEANSRDFLSSDDDEPIGPVGEALVWSVSLGMLHFTLDVLVFNQYRQEFEWREIWTRTGSMLPALFLVVWMLRTKTARRWEKLRQIFFFAVSVLSGCYLIRSGNQDGYYAVMKRAPPVGTLWIWSAIEMDLYFALAHVLIVGLYMWWNGFSAF